jgi:hypothetical protein
MTAKLFRHGRVFVIACAAAFGGCSSSVPPPAPPAVPSSHSGVGAAPAGPNARVQYIVNLSNCLASREPCDRSRLTDDDARLLTLVEPRPGDQVGGPDVATRDIVPSRAYQANLDTCLAAITPELCDRGLLTTADAARVAQAEYRFNLHSCTADRVSPRCRLSMLNPADLYSVTSLPGQIAPAPVQPAAVSPVMPARVWQVPSARAPPPTIPYCAENGSCYGDVSALTGKPKTTHVRGYFRRDGTYVRGHYRGRRR